MVSFSNPHPIVALQLDPLSKLNPKTDTSLFLAAEAQRRGFRLFAYTPAQLTYSHTGVFADGLYFDVTDTGEVTVGESQRLDLAKASYVLIRQNPPYDMNYIGCLDILMTLSKTTRVLNSPKALRTYSEKSIPLLFPDLCPRTIITRTPVPIYEMLEIEKKIILKPLYGFGGLDVFLVDRDDVNADALINLMCDRYPEGIIAQQFISGVRTNDRRLIFIDGELKSVYNRIPKDGTVRANTVLGGSIVACDISEADKRIAQRLSPFLKEQDIMLCGADAIDDYLIEVNITSPTGLRAVQELYGINLAAAFWDRVSH